jgi:hypothetical protein
MPASEDRKPRFRFLRGVGRSIWKFVKFLDFLDGLVRTVSWLFRLAARLFDGSV